MLFIVIAVYIRYRKSAYNHPPINSLLTGFDTHKLNKVRVSLDDFLLMEQPEEVDVSSFMKSKVVRYIWSEKTIEPWGDTTVYVHDKESDSYYIFEEGVLLIIPANKTIEIFNNCDLGNTGIRFFKA